MLTCIHLYEFGKWYIQTSDDIIVQMCHIVGGNFNILGVLRLFHWKKQVIYDNKMVYVRTQMIAMVNKLTNEPRHEKTCLQTGLRSHRR